MVLASGSRSPERTLRRWRVAPAPAAGQQVELLQEALDLLGQAAVVVAQLEEAAARRQHLGEVRSCLALAVRAALRASWGLEWPAPCPVVRSSQVLVKEGAPRCMQDRPPVGEGWT